MSYYEKRAKLAQKQHSINRVSVAQVNVLNEYSNILIFLIFNRVSVAQVNLLSEYLILCSKATVEVSPKLKT